MPRHMRWAWRIVLVMMLAAAAWSVSGELMAWGMPNWLAYPLSLMFDAAGLLSAGYAQRAIERNTAALAPRAAVLAFVTVSGLVNYAHGEHAGGRLAAYGLASISGLVEALFELHRRDIRDSQRANLGLVPRRLPRLPLLGWVMFPRRSWDTLRRAVGVRLDTADESGPSAPDPDTSGGRPDRHQATVRSAIRAALDTMPGAHPADIAAHLTGLGIPVTPDQVRAETGQQDTSPGTVRQLPIRRTASEEPTIADTVRRLVAAGVRAKDELHAGVQAVHGPVEWDTVRRTRDRVQRGA